MENLLDIFNSYFDLSLMKEDLSEKVNLLGWKAQIELRNGIEKTYDWFINNNAKGSI